MKIDFQNLSILLPLFLATSSLIWLTIKSKAPLTLKILRTLTILILTALVLSPKITTYAKKQKNEIAVMIDTSDSMFATKRVEYVKNYLKINHNYLEQNYNIGFFDFSENFRHIDYKKTKLKSSGRTDIINSLENLFHAYPNLDGIFLFSDGRQTSEEATRVEVVREAKIPIFSFDIFEKKKFLDISLFDIKAPPFAFKGKDFTVKAKLVHAGIKRGSPIVVNLTDEDGVVVTRRIEAGDEDEAEVVFVVRPKKRGANNYKIDVSTHPGEITHLNNSSKVTVEAIKEKIRVLYLCGQPSYEYSFLREHLKNDANIELVSFVILRNPEDIALVPDEELSLIPFPGANMLIKDIADFDLVIFENFTYQRFGIYAPHFEALKKWVLEGGGFIMMGGDNSFARGGYQNTAIRDILPVFMEDPSDAIEEGIFRPQITDHTSPLFAIETETPSDLWKELPELDGAQKLKIRPEGKILIRHPWSKTDIGNTVVLATRDYGKGRTAALGSNSTWRWKMHSKYPEIYHIFWKNMVGYLTGSLDESKANVLGLRKNVAIDTECEFLVKPQTGGIEVKTDITAPDGSKITPEKAKSGALWRFSFTPTLEGSYKINIYYSKGGRLISKETHSVEVSRSVYEELKNLDINPTFLKDISEKTGGTYIDTAGFDLRKIDEKIPKKASEIKTETMANTTIYAFLLITVIFIFELAIRWLKYDLW